MSDLEKLVEAQRDLDRCNAEIEMLKKLHIAPVQAALAAAGERANALWLAVLKQYGSGRAQRALREALEGGDHVR